MLSETIKLAHAEGTTNFNAALKLYPDFLLHYSDEYMATVIQELQL
jgi:hypothetical protein